MVIHPDLLIKDKVLKKQYFNDKYERLLWQDGPETNNEAACKNTAMAQLTIKPSIINEPLSSDQSFGKEQNRKGFLPVAPMISCLVISSVLTWVSLNDLKISIGCTTVLLLCLDYVICERNHDIYDLCFILATCCGFLVMLSFLYGVSVEGIQVNACIIVSTMFSLLSAGYFINRPRTTD